MENKPKGQDEIRHWYIQKPIAHNCPLNQGKGVDREAAVFTEFAPTVSMQNCEWVRVYSADDIQKKIGMGLTRYVEVMTELAHRDAQLKIAVDALEDIRDREYDRAGSTFNIAEDALEAIKKGTIE